MFYVRRVTEGNFNVKNDVIFDEGRLVWLNDNKIMRWIGVFLW